MFRLLVVQSPKPRKIIDAIMKAELKAPEGTHSYYMVCNCEQERASHMFWYLDKVYLLVKPSYMSKEVFSPLYNVERGMKIE